MAALNLMENIFHGKKDTYLYMVHKDSVSSYRIVVRKYIILEAMCLIIWPKPTSNCRPFTAPQYGYMYPYSPMVFYVKTLILCRFLRLPYCMADSGLQ